MAKKDKSNKRSSMRERAKRGAQKRQSEGGGSTTLKTPQDTKFFKPKKGSMDIDFIPYVVNIDNHPDLIPSGEQWYRREYSVHRNIGIDENSYVCLKSFGLKCPICEEWALMKKRKDVDDETAKALKPSRRELFNVVDANDPDEGLLLWDMSYFNFGNMLDEEIAEADDEDIAGFAEAEGGMTVGVRFKEKSFAGNKFCQASRIDFGARDDIEDDILDEVLDLDELLIQHTYDDLAAILFGSDVSSGDEEEKEEEEDETPAEKKKRLKKEKAAAEKKAAEEEDPDLEDMDHDELLEHAEENDIEVPKKLKKESKKNTAALLELITEASEEPDPDSSSDDDTSVEDMDHDELLEYAEENDLDVPKKLKKENKKNTAALRELCEEHAADDGASGDGGDYDDMDKDELVDAVVERELLKKAKAKKLDEDELRELLTEDDADGGGSEDGDCPDDHKFGTDNDEHDECMECDCWDACKDAFDEAEKKKKKK